jgi:hypothetical protein
VAGRVSGKRNENLLRSKTASRIYRDKIENARQSGTSARGRELKAKTTGIPKKAWKENIANTS